jgi:hypothetical protein
MAQDLRQDATSNPPTCKGDPAPQPSDPGADCTPLAAPPLPPCYAPPKKCEPSCDCPEATGNPPGCLEDLIKGEADAISKGEQAKKFKADLEALMAKVKAAALEYTQDAYKDLLERWKKEDEAIVCLIRSIDCALDCWPCVIECEICPLVNDIVRLESKLSGEAKTCDKGQPTAGAEQPQKTDGGTCDGSAPTQAPDCDASNTMTSVYDIRHWWWREKLRRQALFNQVAAVMKAWETPFKTLDAALKANAEILKNAAAMLGVDQKRDAAKLLFDVFFRLVPTHLAIAPPASKAQTGIARKYVEFCCCDNSPTVYGCCGPEIRLPTVRDRIVGALPYLIDPSKYSDLVCCLAKNVYQPAKAQAAEADSRYAEFDTEAKAAEAAIDAQLKSLAADVKVRLGKTIDCKDYGSLGGDGSKHKCCGDDAPSQTEDPAQTSR